jgi:hypothetical protein
MKVLTAKVVDGKIEIGDDLQDGSTVAVIALEPGAPVLTAEDEQELAQSLAEIRSGNYVDGHQLVAELKARHQR